jgi:hypothetical protein
LYSTDPDISSEVVKGTERLMKLLQAHTLCAPIDLESLTSYDLVPKKNYDTNRLSRGDLQILNSTGILFDETHMKAGKSEGERLIHNMRAIAELIEEQTVKYNFQYHDQNFDCSAFVIIVSTGRSVFKNARPVPINPVRTPNSDALNGLSDELIGELRLYLSQVSRQGHMEIPDECSNHIQEKYVNARKEEDDAIKEQRKDTNEVGAKTLHTWLTYSKLRVIAHGQEQCSSDIVDHIINMEKDRVTRVEEVVGKETTAE